MFEKASKLKLRFETSRGAVSTEDLWDIPLTSRDGFDLDNIAKAVNRKIKSLEEESFVQIKKSTKATLEALRLDILKHIINVKLEELQDRRDALIKKEKKEKLLAAIQEKQDASLKDKSLEELEAELKDLE